MTSGQTWDKIVVSGAREHNLKNLDLSIDRGKITVITGVSGSGKSSLAFDTILAESNRRFFYTLSHYTRQFLDLGSRPSVASISGLSPAIALAQNETQPSIRASVGSLTDVSELLGVLFARFGEQRCPDHGLLTSGTTIEQVLSQILTKYDGQIIGLCAPFVEQKKGAFKKPLQQFSSKGFLKAYIDGEIVSLASVPELDKDKKHDIKIIVDFVKVSEKRRERLENSLRTVFEIGGQLGEFFLSDKTGKIESDFQKVSIAMGCPQCGFSWPKLDSRYFSANSLGRCEKCNGLGIQDPDNVEAKACGHCRGPGLKRDLEFIEFKGKTPQKMQVESVDQLSNYFDTWQEQEVQNPALARILSEVAEQLRRLRNVGLGYLSLARRIRSLSGGEAQRVRLAGVLAENLRGVLYVLDEPSQGLSDQELDTLWTAIERLKAQGNTILIVDHDETMIKRADWIIDLWPEGGARGGQIMAKFSPDSAATFARESLTAEYLSRTPSKAVSKSKKPDKFITITKPRLNNLKMPEVKIPLNSFTVVSGVSGAGKSSLVTGVLFNEVYQRLSDEGGAGLCDAIDGIDDITEIFLVDRKPIAKSSVSMPATYLDVFSDLRKFYGNLPDAQILGLTAREFSTSVEGGRCPDCKGKGQMALSMKFLSDAKITCPTCQGDRYKPEVLQVRYKGLNLSEVLALTIDEVLEHFATFKKIVRRLQPAKDLGLGYLKLGQPSSSLSGGESQRLKLAPILYRSMSEGTILVMDEPTTGLHFKDVEKLLNQCRALTDMGVTLVVIEHSQKVQDAADWVLKVGPGSANNGGELLN